jgi:hypothetical protein
MLEMGIAEVQSQFTKLLSKAVTIVDKKSHKKRAVILPYGMYEELIKEHNKQKVFEEDRELDAFVGILKGANTLDIDDER